MALFWKFETTLVSFFQISICLGSIKLLDVRPGPIFGLEAMETSKDGILLSWLPGSREVEEYRLTITSECNNWKIPECEKMAQRIRRSTEIVIENSWPGKADNRWEVRGATLLYFPPPEN